jgi:hypothetical protein
VKSGEITRATALQIIRDAREKVQRVRTLLVKLGDRQEHLPLRRRFSQQAKRIEAASVDPETAQVFSELTLAFQDLCLVLQESFYSPAKS